MKKPLVGSAVRTSVSAAGGCDARGGQARSRTGSAAVHRPRLGAEAFGDEAEQVVALGFAQTLAFVTPAIEFQPWSHERFLNRSISRRRRRSFQFVFLDAAQLGQMVQQANLQWSVPVHRNGKAHLGAIPSVDVMAAIDPEQSPAAPLDKSSEVAAGQ